MRENIIQVFRSADEIQHADGMGWYQRAHDCAVALGEKHDITTRQAAGVIAALSPMLRWELNVTYADRFIGTGYAPCLGLGRRKSTMILGGADPGKVLMPSKRSGQKVNAFFHCIMDPTCDDVCIDRHAYDVALGMTHDDAGRKALSRVGVYDSIRDTYREAASEVGIVPSQLQAVTWVAWREGKTYSRPQHQGLFNPLTAVA